MAENLPTSESKPDEPSAASGSRSGTPAMPRWAKVLLVIGFVLVLLFVVGKLTGVGGEHGPGRHGGGNETPSSVVDEGGGHRSPVEHGQ